MFSQSTELFKCGDLMMRICFGLSIFLLPTLDEFFLALFASSEVFRVLSPLKRMPHVNNLKININYTKSNVKHYVYI
jgi:hypothetical protein